MSGLAAFQGVCPAPFLQESLFPSTGGYIPGRFCAPAPGLPEDIRCCMSCPVTSWIYPDNFYTLTRLAGWINIPSLVCSVFLLLSWAFLPVERTRRHYLSVCLVVAIILLELGFLIPLGVRPNECYNEITPNDMYTSMPCAWSGALVCAGGLAVNTWILIRAFSMHLQIVWDKSPGRRFFWFAQAFGWGVPLILLTITLSVTGVSYRFGDTCHVNHYQSMADFWGPLLGISGLGMLLQLTTLGYCFHVYLQNLWTGDDGDSNSSNSLPSHNSSSGPQKARIVYRRVKKVVWLQWRGLAIVMFVLIDVVFFAIVFVYMDNSTDSITTDVNVLMPWLICLVSNDGNKNECVHLAGSFVVNEATTMAVLIMLAIIGMQAYLLLGRWSMVTGWWHLLKRPTKEFVSLDAKRLSHPNSPHPYARQAQPPVAQYFTPQTNYELLKFGSPTASTITEMIASPAEAYRSPSSPGGASSRASDYFSKEDGKMYRPPTFSFSNPRIPSQRTDRLVRQSTMSFESAGLGLRPLRGGDVSPSPSPSPYTQRRAPYL